MGRFIGEDLTEREIAALQAVYDNAGHARFGYVSELRKTIQSHRQCWAIEEVTDEELGVLLKKLEDEGLICRAYHQHENNLDLIGLTDEGERCNLIDTY